MRGEAPATPGTSLPPTRRGMPRDPSWRWVWLPVVVGAGVIGGLTAVVVLLRAGGNPQDAANWPVQWELRSSDNGVLFQLMQDVAAGRPLDWSFSPQVFVFPELPLSALAFGVTGGNIYGYYVAVAVLNNLLLFVTLLGLVRVLSPLVSPVESTLRAAIGAVPLVALPLVGTSWIFSFHLAPTYYFGMYLALLAAPILVLTPSRSVRVTLGVALALTAASNPLTVLFAAPGGVLVLGLLLSRRGVRGVVRPAAGVGILLLVVFGVRLLLTPLQGTSPFTYMNLHVFARRLAQILPYFEYQARDPAARVILVAGAVLAVLCLLASFAAAVLVWRRGATRPLLGVVYLGLIPLGGVGMTYLGMITHYLYFWPVLVLPFVLCLLALPRGALRASGIVGAATLACLAASTGLVGGNLGHLDSYLGYRNAETMCIADAVPHGAIGYATFSDARRLSLPSAGGFRLIQLWANATPDFWLTNKAAVRSEAGTFFYLNGSGDEPQIDPTVLRRLFGSPDVVSRCSGTQSVWRYTESAKLKRIASYYRVG